MKMFILLVLVSSFVNADTQKSRTNGISSKELNAFSDGLNELGDNLLRELKKNQLQLNAIEDRYKRSRYRKTNRKVKSTLPKAPSTIYPYPH